jgi:hypothetical protein
MKRTHRLLAPAILIAAILALALAASASAEVRVGEASSPADAAIPAEADIVHATASYDSATGAMGFTVTTVKAPQAEDEEGEPSEIEMYVGFVTATDGCDEQALLNEEFTVPGVQVSAPYSEPDNARIEILTSASQPPVDGGPATRTVTGTTIAISGQLATLADQTFNCAVVMTYSSGFEPSYLIFPIAVPPPPAPPAETTTTTPVQAAASTPPAPSAPAPAPAALSIARSKPLKLKQGKWATVKVELVNTGGTSSVPGSLRIKAPKGVTVKPETQRLPLLTPGGSWTITARVQVTAKAKTKTKSALALTATAGGLVAKGSLVLKRQG